LVVPRAELRASIWLSRCSNTWVDSASSEPGISFITILSSLYISLSFISMVNFHEENKLIFFLTLWGFICKRYTFWSISSCIIRDLISTAGS
jgi:hypothetical protein